MVLPKRILIANRGTAATRIMRCCNKLSIPFITVYSLEDCDSLHVTKDSVCLHDTSSKALDTYLNWETLFRICEEKQCDAIHPGYGFLSENAEFAEECEARNITFIGPTPEQISSFGLKHSARALAQKHDVPLLPGTGLLRDLGHAKMEAASIGYPVLLKCVAGGGGIGMKVCDNEQALVTGFESVKRLAQNAFKDDGVFLEKFLPKARHVEVQIFGDGKGNVIALGERDCSTQRRNQKVVEESPAPYLTSEVREKLWASAVRLMKGVGYRTAGTVEYVVDAMTLDFYFLEVNTRIQVEHGVTEQVYSCDGEGVQLDLIEWMIRASRGDLDLSESPQFAPKYHSIQCRIYAEDANKNFQPAAGGILTAASFPSPSEDVRVETWVRTGCRVSSLYDPMVAKLIVRGKTREEAIARMLKSLSKTVIAGGVETNLEFLEQILDCDLFREFKDGKVFTNWLQGFTFQPQTIDVLDPGTQTSIQDYPGRIGYWAPGVPPSGPMDHLAFRVANQLVGNSESAAGLEMTLQGATLKFNCDCAIALTGAIMDGDLDGSPPKFWETMTVTRGSILTLRGSKQGCRTYLAVSGGGFDVPEYLGSKSTFALGKFGGHAGRNLVHGDVLHLVRHDQHRSLNPIPKKVLTPPTYETKWNLHVLAGPHSAPDFFTEKFIASSFFTDEYTVHYNSNRLGIRLSGGSKPEFTRLDGGEAGLHPSNIHDTVYAVGTINFTGDLPVILGLDGPSLGGFVCPATIVKADLWKIGQLRPGDTIRFVLTDYETAVRAETALDEWIASEGFKTRSLELPYKDGSVDPRHASAILKEFYVDDGVKVVYRQAGDHNILIEYGELVLDLKLRCRVHALMTYLSKNPIRGIIELSPGVRSVQVQFDSRKFSSLNELLDLLESAEKELDKVESMIIPSRIISLPLAFEASSTHMAISKYRQSVRDKAPWLPSNVEFIRRINGLESQEQVKQTVFNSSFLVLGLGDVYLGAPCAVPLDPRHRLLTTKYNPARTWTEEGEVGIGGVFMCIYGMQSPGGYQLIGRTVPIWEYFPRDPQKTQWLLKSFDQVRFHLVSESDLMDCRRRLARGEPCSDMIRIEQSAFVVSDYLDFLSANTEAISAFQQKQRIAFEMERDSWTKDDDYGIALDNEPEQTKDTTVQIPIGCTAVRSQIAGNVWSINVSEGDLIKKNDTVLVVEAMKLEINIPAPCSGRVRSFHVKPGMKCSHGDVLLIIDENESNEETMTVEDLKDVSIPALHELYFSKRVPVTAVFRSLLSKIDKELNEKHPFVWISRRPSEAVLEECRRLDELIRGCSDGSSMETLLQRFPLLGVPFAAKDNIDVLDLPTSCACPDYAYMPRQSAHVVEALIGAGAVLLGKSNMDQFAAGLVGARSPYGSCASVKNPEYVSGGSSSGSGVAVGSGMVTFALGTDTAGSGRVPAMYNDIVGLKPSRGLISTRGVVPACKSLDCVSVFATSVDDAEKVLMVAAEKQDVLDPYSKPRDVSKLKSSKTLGRTFTFGVPLKLEFFGDEEARASYDRVCDRLKSIGGIQKTINFDVFTKTANLLYQGPWVAERLEALLPFFCEENKDKIHPVTWKIISGGLKYSAVDCFKAFHELESLKRLATEDLERMDVLLCPTAPTHYKLADVLSDPVQLNSNLGIYTNFVNLLDLSALAVPTREYSTTNKGMPFGVTFIGKAFEDLFLGELARAFLASPVPMKPIDLAVVGAHLTGMPLNHQLTTLGAKLVREARTLRGRYRLFALTELKPGMVRNNQDDGEATIALEIWRFPDALAFGTFVGAIPAPLGVGTIDLDDGTQVLSFVCESYAIENARDITSFGGWRAFKADMNKV